MMYLEYLSIFFIVSLLVCLVGFYKSAYFLSLGYGFSVTGIGVCMAMLCMAKQFHATVTHYIFFGLFVVYGLRLAGFLFLRETENATYKKVLSETGRNANKMSFFGKVGLWIFAAALYVAQTSPVFFQIYNGGIQTTSTWFGVILSAIGLVLETVADLQKSAQKKENPDMVATKGLYGLVRCPNYFGEILFWTGVFVSSLVALSGVGQWVIALAGYLCILFVMVNATQRLDKRQMEQYGANEEYKKYVKTTPILFPFIPLYHLNKR